MGQVDASQAPKYTHIPLLVPVMLCHERLTTGAGPYSGLVSVGAALYLGCRDERVDSIYRPAVYSRRQCHALLDIPVSMCVIVSGTTPQMRTLVPRRCRRRIYRFMGERESLARERRERGEGLGGLSVFHMFAIAPRHCMRTHRPHRAHTSKHNQCTVLLVDGEVTKPVHGED